MNLFLPTEAPPLVKVVPVARLEGHAGRVWCVSWCPVANVLASCSSDGSVKLWACLSQDVQEGADSSGRDERVTWSCIHTLDGEHSRTVRHVSWSPSGGFVACASFDRTVSVWKRSSDDTDCFEFELETVLDGHESEVKCVAWGTDNTLATCSRDRTVWVWDRVDVGEFECAGVLTGHAQDVKACAWIPPLRGDRPVLLSCSYDNTVKLWTESHRRDDWFCSQTLAHHEKTVWSIAVQPVEQSIDALCPGETVKKDERNIEDAVPICQPILCCGSDDCTVSFWARDKDRKFRCVCALSGFAERSIYSVSWAPSMGLGTPCAMVACGSGDNKLTLLGLHRSVCTGEVNANVVAEVPCAHEADVNSVAFSPTSAASVGGNVGFLLASGGDDCVVRLWHVSVA
ncbi:hypothetical protein TRVL_10290 [Trypanosoma vivax]|nr:hypothetical protein TRVL_10290 [Trypanosoma vivax]